MLSKASDVLHPAEPRASIMTCSLYQVARCCQLIITSNPCLQQISADRPCSQSWCSNQRAPGCNHSPNENIKAAGMKVLRGRDTYRPSWTAAIFVLLVVGALGLHHRSNAGSALQVVLATPPCFRLQHFSAACTLTECSDWTFPQEPTLPASTYEYVHSLYMHTAFITSRSLQWPSLVPS